MIFAGGDGCYKVLRREPMLASRIFIWQELTRMSKDEVRQTIPAFHPVWADVDTTLINAIDKQAAHGSFRNWAWITPVPPSRGVVVPRPPRAPCHGAAVAAGAGDVEPAGENGDVPAAVLATRLGRVAHPLHAAALAITTLTRTRTEQLALIRGIDIDTAATTVKTHDSPAHRHCRIHRAPTWARTLLAAAATFHQLTKRDPGSALFPLITTHGNGQLDDCFQGVGCAHKARESKIRV